MKSLTVLILIVLNTLGSSAQGIYFDSLYHANETVNNSVLAQIFATDSGYITVGLHGPSNQKQLELVHLDFDGTQLSAKNWAWPDPTSTIYWYGKAFKPLQDGGYIWSDDFGSFCGIIKFNENLDTTFTITFPSNPNEEYKDRYLILERENYFFGATVIISSENGWVYTGDIEIIKFSNTGEILMQDTLELYDPEYQYMLSGIYGLDDGGFIISGARMFDWEALSARNASKPYEYS